METAPSARGANSPPWGSRDPMKDASAGSANVGRGSSGGGGTTVIVLTGGGGPPAEQAVSAAASITAPERTQCRTSLRGAPILTMEPPSVLERKGCSPLPTWVRVRS